MYTSFKPSSIVSDLSSISSSAKPTSTSSASSATFLQAFKSVVQAKTATLSPVSSQPATMQVSLRKDIKLNVQNLIQGQNECGPTSLAMIMQYYGINPGNYHEMFGSDTVGHGPLALRKKASDKGLTVRQENNGSLEDLAALIDKGIPAMVLGIYGGGSNSSLSDYINNASKAHWMTVTGYKKDDAGRITHIYFNNPNRSTVQCWTASDFLTKFWNNNIIPDGHRYYMAMAPRGSFQEASLKKLLPSDKISDSFRMYLQVVDGLERAFYEAEAIADDIADFFKDLFS